MTGRARRKEERKAGGKGRIAAKTRSLHASRRKKRAVQIARGWVYERKMRWGKKKKS